MALIRYKQILRLEYLWAQTIAIMVKQFKSPDKQQSTSEKLAPLHIDESHKPEMTEEQALNE